MVESLIERLNLWDNEIAVNSLKKIVPHIGHPSTIAYGSGGSCIWTNKSIKNDKILKLENVFEEHILRDERIPHNCPKKHYEFFYSYMKADISPEILPYINSISGSVLYDPLKKEVCARSDSIEVNIATLRTVFYVLTSKYPKKRIEKIHSEGLYGKSVSYIKKSEENMKKTYKSLIFLYKKHKKNGNITSIGYWKGAFGSKDCDPGPYNNL